MLTLEQTCFLIGELTVEITTTNPNNALNKLFKAGRTGESINIDKIGEILAQPDVTLDPALRQRLDMLQSCLDALNRYATEQEYDCAAYKETLARAALEEAIKNRKEN